MKKSVCKKIHLLIFFLLHSIPKRKYNKFQNNNSRNSGILRNDKFLVCMLLVMICFKIFLEDCALCVCAQTALNINKRSKQAYM